MDNDITTSWRFDVVESGMDYTAQYVLTAKRSLVTIKKGDLSAAFFLQRDQTKSDFFNSFF